jgi:hypothetical protein
MPYSGFQFLLLLGRVPNKPLDFTNEGSETMTRSLTEGGRKLRKGREGEEGGDWTGTRGRVWQKDGGGREGDKRKRMGKLSGGEKGERERGKVGKRDEECEEDE